MQPLYYIMFHIILVKMYCKFPNVRYNNIETQYIDFKILLLLYRKKANDCVYVKINLLFEGWRRANLPFVYLFPSITRIIIIIRFIENFISTIAN